MPYCRGTSEQKGSDTGAQADQVGGTGRTPDGDDGNTLSSTQRFDPLPADTPLCNRFAGHHAGRCAAIDRDGRKTLPSTRPLLLRYWMKSWSHSRASHLTVVSRPKTKPEQILKTAFRATHPGAGPDSGCRWEEKGRNPRFTSVWSAERAIQLIPGIHRLPLR